MYILINQTTKHLDGYLSSTFTEFVFTFIFGDNENMYEKLYNYLKFELTKILSLNTEDKIYVDISIHTPINPKTYLGFLRKIRINEIANQITSCFESFYEDCKIDFSLPNTLEEFITSELIQGGIQMTVFHIENPSLDHKLFTYVLHPYSLIVESTNFGRMNELREKIKNNAIDYDEY